jgi:hypothetical protein
LTTLRHSTTALWRGQRETHANRGHGGLIFTYDCRSNQPPNRMLSAASVARPLFCRLVSSASAASCLVPVACLPHRALTLAAAPISTRRSYLHSAPASSMSAATPAAASAPAAAQASGDLSVMSSQAQHASLTELSSLQARLPRPGALARSSSSMLLNRCWFLPVSVLARSVVPAGIPRNTFCTMKRAPVPAPSSSRACKRP